MAEISITAEPLNGQRCLFLGSRPVAPTRWGYMGNRDAAQGSPLGEALFQIEGIAALVIAHDLIVITRSGDPGLPLVGPYVRMVRRALGDRSAKAPVDWKSLGTRVGQVVRLHLAAGVPALSDALTESMPSPQILRQRVEIVLAEQVNPVVASHGGGVELVDLVDNVVYLRMSGGCQGCGLADITLRHGVDAAIRDVVPEIGRIHDLTNHAAGVMPYRLSGTSPFAQRR